ncbi:PREDICTED: protoheme IX farnesyltransferase, mitochondrial [Fragaria vesca subsp. vesca]|uniref:protoheme IX farnesyltransferase, mitochondrial n=1 Tax=Fragaria vesca subsp. vesca TaxID=101020 RepID=UPI0002C34AD8|nr:PREDICTED: protoheme IX farnesyltransferase, mitochondrial [Fragaria vesca subsp. vesca]
MWRNSVSFSSQLIRLNKTLFNPSTSGNDVVRPLLHCRSEFHPYSSSPPSSSDYLKLGFQPSDGLQALSATTSDLASLASKSADLTRQYARCYWELSKARLSMLVVATSGTGYVLGSGSAVDLAGLCYTCAGTMMVAASANSLNQVFEKYNDAKMKRTMQRPLPSGRITRPHAVAWACTTGLAGTALLASKANMLAAGLGASNLILYAFVYTPLKQIHPVNTWVGAVVGAIPPLLGWAAASGQISLNAMILPAALYFWQIPHFMALAYLCRNDYAAGGFRMFSLADASGQRTASVALRNCAYLIPLGYVAYDWGVTSGWFCIESTILTLAISATAFSFYRDRTTHKARRMFHASLLYLPVFMSGILFHRISDNQQCLAEESSQSIAELSMSSQDGNAIQKHKLKKHRPPVSYASVAPFPFLPVPSYVSS